MERKIIQIEETLCNGCGLCISACHEHALMIQDGKAKLIREDYCDGLGDCLPECPQNAISFIYKEAMPYDEFAVKTPIQVKEKQLESCHLQHTSIFSLPQWPIQLQLLPTQAAYYMNADMLLCADCCAYVNPMILQDVKGKVLMIACPKLDVVDYTEKLTMILSQNEIRSIKLLRMEVPCCKGLERAIENAILNSGKDLPLQTLVLTTKGLFNSNV